jgi:hypothetical protein
VAVRRCDVRLDPNLHGVFSISCGAKHQRPINMPTANLACENREATVGSVAMALRLNGHLDRRIQCCVPSSVRDLVAARRRIVCFGTEAEAKAPPSDLARGLSSAVNGIFLARQWSMNALCWDSALVPPPLPGAAPLSTESE